MQSKYYSNKIILRYSFTFYINNITEYHLQNKLNNIKILVYTKQWKRKIICNEYAVSGHLKHSKELLKCHLGFGS